MSESYSASDASQVPRKTKKWQGVARSTEGRLLVVSAQAVVVVTVVDFRTGSRTEVRTVQKARSHELQAQSSRALEALPSGELSAPGEPLTVLRVSLSSRLSVPPSSLQLFDSYYLR